MIDVKQFRALEAFIMSQGPLKADVVERAKEMAPHLDLLDDGSDEFAALADLVRAMAYAEIRK